MKTKTYSRKKSDEEERDEEIVDLDEICRLCMEKKAQLISIFTQDDSIPLTLRIMACVSLEVFEGDGLPDKICHPCKFQLEKSYNFKKKCEQSDMKLRVHLKVVQDDLKAVFDDCVIIEQEEITIAQNQADDSFEEDGEYENQQDVQDGQPTTEEDIVGITKVAYIPQEPEDDRDSITLSMETNEENRNACTLPTAVDLKEEEDDQEDASMLEESIFIIEERASDDWCMESIADAVKTTLAGHPNFQPDGQLELKVNPSKGNTTEVEVRAEDGSSVILQVVNEYLSTESKNEERSAAPMPVNEDGEHLVFHCPECPKSFSRRIQLRRHSSVHITQRGLSCGICEKWFPTRSALVRHERIHTGERPYQCEVCAKRFTQKEILFRHMAVHTERKPYVCTECNKDFSQRAQLRTHLQTHSEHLDPSALHYCSLCPKAFCHASGLSRHLVTHTGKLYTCSDCDKQFNDKSALKRHAMVHDSDCTEGSLK